MKKKILILIIILLFPCNIHALSCEEQKVEANKVKYTYRYKFNKKIVEPTFDIKFSDLGDLKVNIDDFVTADKNNQEVYIYPTDEEGENVKKFSIYTEECGELRAINVTFPYYNELSHDKICDGLNGYKFCEPTVDKLFDIKDLMNEMKSIKKEIGSTENKDQNNNKVTFTKILVIVFIILLILNILVYVVRKVKRSHEKFNL